MTCAGPSGALQADGRLGRLGRTPAPPREPQGGRGKSCGRVQHDQGALGGHSHSAQRVREPPRQGKTKVGGGGRC